MPNYEYLCPNGHLVLRYLALVNHSPLAVCDCGEMATQIISAPVLVTAQPECRYDSPITGEPITSWAARRDDLARHDCIEYDPGLKTDAERRVKEQEADLDRKVEEHVERSIERMPTKQRGRLWSELTEQGADLQYTRRTGGPTAQ